MGVEIERSTADILDTAIKELTAGDDGAHWEPGVIAAAKQIYSANRPAFQRKRSELKKASKDAQIAEWTAEVTGCDSSEGGANAGDLVAADDEPWLSPVGGAELLDDVHAILTRHMVLPEGSPVALALWTLGTYVFDAFRIWPKLSITSPEKRCGKTTLLSGILAPLVHRGLAASSITPAAIFRVVEKWSPTLLIDEADSFLSSNDELRGIVNSGHTRSGAFVIRSVGDDHEPKRFSTWSPMAIAMIKTPPGTIVDRSVVVQMRRRMPGELVVKLPLDFEDFCVNRRRRCKRWADDNLASLRQASPKLPASANDRALDNWTPLLAIAEAVGGTWPAAAMAAFHCLSPPDDDSDIGPMILEDIRRVFEERQWVKVHSADLVSELVGLEERPWAEWRHGRPLSTSSLARLLKPYGLKSRQVRIGATNRHGYLLGDFADAFGRYLVHASPDTPFQDATTLQPRGGAAFSEIQNATPGESVAFQNSRKPSGGAGCSVVALQKGVGGGDRCGAGKESPADSVDTDESVAAQAYRLARDGRGPEGNPGETP